VLNNIILSTATATVLLGTLFPLIREATDGEAVSVGAPFFNLTFTPLMILAMAVCRPVRCWPGSAATPGVRRLWLALAAAPGPGRLRRRRRARPWPAAASSSASG
jgi:cytochrome c-type biogenesis protein CcmF